MKRRGGRGRVGRQGKGRDEGKEGERAGKVGGGA